MNKKYLERDLRKTFEQLDDDFQTLQEVLTRVREYVRAIKDRLAAIREIDKENLKK